LVPSRWVSSGAGSKPAFGAVTFHCRMGAGLGRQNRTGNLPRADPSRRAARGGGFAAGGSRSRRGTAPKIKQK